MNQRTYKIRSFSNGKNRQGEPFVNYSLTIPSQIAEKLPKEMQFYCELVPDGLLFRPVPPEQEQIVLPPWAVTENGSEAESTKPKRPARKKPTKPAAKPRSKPTSRSKPRSKAEAKPEPAPDPEPSQEPSAEPIEQPAAEEATV